MAIDRSSNPYYLNDFLTYTKVIKIRSDRTVEAYYNDIKLFLKYLKRLRTNMPADTKLESVSIKDIPIDMLKDITLSDIYDFLYFASEDLKNNDRTRARKSSSLRAFFKYLSKQAHLLDSDPLKDLEMPSIKQKLPKYLTLDDSVNLLEAVADSEDKYFERDYCIITLFINCGMRLSELVGINLRDINMDERTLRLLGKGNKERIIYINNACVDAVSAYLKV
ncbi:MAG: tyrosine-type recombinase/integrase, partial [Ruminococcus sp.]|nr:tyrosine-type recombinase/integrase [Ruminococcus sp.]